MTAAPDPESLTARCRCGEELWKIRDGQWTLANKILKLTQNGIAARCPTCRGDVAVPFLAIVPPPARPKRLFVRGRRLTPSGGAV